MPTPNFTHSSDPTRRLPLFLDLYFQYYDLLKVRSNLRQGGSNGDQPLRDLTAIRQFLTGNGLFAFFDAPWAPLFIVVIFLLHPLLGLVSLIGGLILLGLAFLTEKRTQRPLEAANTAGIAANQFASNSFRNAAMYRIDSISSYRGRFKYLANEPADNDVFRATCCRV